MMTTIDNIIEALGGKDAAAEKLGVQEQSVRKWRQNGVPTKHWRYIVGATNYGYHDLEPFHPDQTQPAGE